MKSKAIMKKGSALSKNEEILKDIRQLIESARQQVATHANTT